METKVDSKAPPCTCDDALLREAMQNLRPSRGAVAKPNKGKPKIKRTKVKAKPSSSQGTVITPDLVDPVDFEENGSGDIEVKTELTGRELAFLKLHLIQGVDQVKAMKSSGYRSSQDKYLQYAAKKILVKYESRTEDHRRIFREIGAGEVAVAKGLLNLATTAKSEQVRLNAWTVIAKCLGLTKEIVEGVQGVRIVINAANGESLKVGVCAPAIPSHEFPQAISIKD
jgi:hypothetical protein